MSTPVDNTRAETLCKFGKGAETCSFLSMTVVVGFTCEKGSGIEDIIRSRRAEGTMKAKGDNCSGPPNFTPNPT